MNYIPPPKELPAGSIVDIYLRDSGGEKQDRSVDSQLLEIKAYCKQFHLTLREVYKDEAKSGRSISKRTDFIRMIENIQAKKDNPKGLLIWDYARFGRNAEEANWGIVVIEHEKVIVHSIVDYIPDGAWKQLGRQIKHTGNQSQIENNVASIKRMQHQLVNNNKAMFGTPPRGMMRQALEPVRNARTGELRTHHKWIPDPEISPLILRAFEMKAQNKTLREINLATGLYKSVSCYSDFFPNKLYKGVLEFGGDVIENYCEPIVPPELWDKVNSKRAKLRPGNGIRDPRRIRSRYLLSGLLHCQHCGGAMVGYEVNGFFYYDCSTRKLSRNERCNARRISKKEIELAVLEHIKNNALSLDTLFGLQNSINQKIYQNKDIQKSERLKLDRELGTAEKKITNLTNAIASHGHSESLLQSLTEAEQIKKNILFELEVLEKDLNITPKTKLQLKDMARAIENILDNGSDVEKMTTLRTFVTRIIASREVETLHAMIYYLPVEIINPAEAGLLGEHAVPLRGYRDEALIQIIIPTKKVRKDSKQNR